MRFSQRIGARPAPTSGLEEASGPLRTALWNELHELLLPTGQDEWSTAHSHAQALWSHLSWRIDEVPHYAGDCLRGLKPYWFGCDWALFFDLVEFSVSLVRQTHRLDTARWFDHINELLESEGCAYRFVSGELAPLTNSIEVAEVAQAAECSVPSVATHIRAALSLLPPRADPSPRNSVKESISAVEAALKHFSGDAGAMFKDGLQAFEEKFGKLHGALRSGLNNLYGYTSDETGVRHALVDGAEDVTVDDARFMLVTCSAFANYLVALSAAKGNAGTP